MGKWFIETFILNEREYQMKCAADVLVALVNAGIDAGPRGFYSTTAATQFARLGLDYPG